MSLARNIRLLEIEEISRSMLFILPVMVPYFRDRIGLDFQEFMMTEAIFAFFVVALEVPSGWLSDIWRRKYVMILSGIFWIMANVLLLIADNLALAIASQISFALAISLVSGTNSALLYDTLLVLGREDEFARLEGRRKGFGFYFLAAASLVSGFLYEIHIMLPLIVSSIVPLAGVLASCLLIEPERYKSAVQGHPIADMIATMKYALHGHAVVGLIILTAASLFVGTKLMMWMQQPYYMQLGLPEISFGILAAVGYGLGGFASHINHLIEGRLGNIRAMIAGLVIVLIVCIGAGVVVGYHGVFLLMLGGSLVYGALMPRVNDAINKRVDSSRRATILSTCNLLRETFFVPLGLMVGWLVTQYGVGGGLYGIAAWLVIAAIIVTILGKRHIAKTLKENGV